MEDSAVYGCIVGCVMQLWAEIIPVTDKDVLDAKWTGVV